MVVPEQSVKSPFWFVTGNIKVLMLCRVLWSWSTSIVYPYFSLYILALGGTSTEVGLISSLGLLAGMFLYPVGGYIADRAGRVKLIGFSTALYTSSHLFFVFANNWQTIALGQFFGQLLLFYVPAMNALQADSLPLGVRGKGFAVMMAVPGAIRVIAPYMGGWIINSFSSGGLTPDEALIKAVRICWGAATVIGFLVAAIRFKYLKETITEESRESVSPRGVPRIIKEAYLSIFESVKWMDRSLRFVVLIEIIAAFFVAMAAPFWVVYAKQVVGITEYQWGLVMLISGAVGITIAFPMGSLVDKIGPRKMILIGIAIAPAVIFLYRYVGGFLGVAAILCVLSLANNMLMPAFSTLIANMIPRARRGRLYSLLGERGVMISFGNFWGGGFLLFPPAALGAFIGGYVYKLNPDYLWIITSAAMLFSFVLVYIFVREPTEAQQ
jgi:DHA1 family multidrug resistance protein-like MFS transporter